MTIVRRVLLLALISASGIALLAPLSARSAARPSDPPPDPLLANPGVQRTDVDRGGALSARGMSVSTVGAHPEAFTRGGVDAPAAIPMEATLVVVPVAAPAAARPAATYSGNTVWDALAKCESGGNWAINTGNGYYGGLQFSLATWNGYGGDEFATYPHQATRDEQIIVAERLRAARGYAPWPACRAKLGLP
jgi:transglycosylase-like protein